MVHHLTLEPWRQDIRSLDEEILQLLAKRMNLVLKIGDYKQQQSLPVKDFQVEKKIIDNARKQAAQIGLCPDLAEELMTTIIRYSVLSQAALQKEPNRADFAEGKAALILGGAGQMGQWFAQFYESLGYTITIFDLKSSNQRQYPMLEHLDQSIDRFDLLVLAAPMPIAAKLLESLILLRPHGLIIDISSLKAPVLPALEAAVAARLNVASIHPMFGPHTDVLTGKNIIFCTGAGLQSELVMQQHFQQTSAQLVTLPLDKHDQHMSYVLGAAHLLNLIFANVLSQSGCKLPALLELGGTTFLQQKKVTSKVIAENQELYFDIQALNPLSPQLYQQFKSTIDNYAAAVASKDRDAFKSLMGYAHDFFNLSNESG